MRSRFGTQLRHLLELCENAVARSYIDEGLDYIPRFTPILRALLARTPLTVGEIAEAARITQPAVTQTVAAMAKRGLITIKRQKSDGRVRLISLSPKGRAMLPKLEKCWDATARAHELLEAELSIPLSAHLDAAIDALERKSLLTRIHEAK